MLLHMSWFDGCSKILQHANALQTPLGNLITVAAMIDDVLSLVILAVIQQLNGNQANDKGAQVWMAMRPVVVSIAFLILGWLLVKYIPRLFTVLRRRWSIFSTPHALNFLVLALSGGLTVAAAYAGTTFLLGAFVGGMAFSTLPGTLEGFVAHANLIDWLTTVFFVSVGLLIPVDKLFSPIGIGYGLAYTIPAFLGKAVTGTLAPPGQKIVVGAAMIGRGETG